MDVADLHRSGRLLHGYSWQYRLAADLRVPSSEVSAWARGLRPVPDRVAAKIAAMLRAKADKVAFAALGTVARPYRVRAGILDRLHRFRREADEVAAKIESLAA